MGPQRKEQGSPRGPNLRLQEEAVGDVFYTQKFLEVWKRGEVLLSRVGTQKDTHQGWRWFMNHYHKTYIYTYMYIEMYVCRNKGSEDINPSTNSAYIQAVAFKLNVPFFFTLFTRRVHPMYNGAETVSCLQNQ